MTYLEEYDQSKQKSQSKYKGDDLKNSNKYSDIVEEDLALRLGSSGKMSKKKDGSSDGSIEDLVQSAYDNDSIKEEIEESFGGSSKHSGKKKTEASRYGTPKDYRKAFDEFKAKPTKEILSDKSGMKQILKQIEKALLKEQKEKEDKLAKELKKRIISTETYDRKIRDVERWVT